MSLDPNKPFHDDDAPTIDKAIASSIIAQYASSNLQTLTGQFQTAEPNQFASWYNKWGGSDEPVADVPGFTNRNDKKKPIKLRSYGALSSISGSQLMKGATFEAAVHETIHLNSNLLFEKQFGWAYNEALTEYFTLKVFGVEKGQGHQDKLFLANGLISAAGHFTMHRPPRMTTGSIHFPIPSPWWQRVWIGKDHAEKYVGNAYFRNGGNELLQQIQQAFSQEPGKSGNANWLAWQHNIHSKHQAPPDWAAAAQLLDTAVSNGAAAGSGGSSASTGSSARP